MNTQTLGLCEKSPVRADGARFSSGPCKKHPSWDLLQSFVNNLGRSHCAFTPKSRLEQAIPYSAKHPGLPVDWQLAIVPASGMEIFELALWFTLGYRGVDIFVWESFSIDWNYQRCLDEEYIKEAA